MDSRGCLALMSTLLGIAIFLVVLFLVLKLALGLAGIFLHLLWIIAIVMFILWVIGKIRGGK